MQPLDERADAKTKAVHELQLVKACIVVAAARAEARFGHHSATQTRPAVFAKWVLAAICTAVIVLLGARIAVSGAVVLIVTVEQSGTLLPGFAVSNMFQQGSSLMLGQQAELVELSLVVMAVLLLVLGVDRGTKVMGDMFHATIRLGGAMVNAVHFLCTAAAGLLALLARLLACVVTQATRSAPPAASPGVASPASSTSVSVPGVPTDVIEREGVLGQTARMTGRAILISSMCVVWPVAAAWTGIEATGSAAAFFAASGAVPSRVLGTPVMLGCAAIMFGLSVAGHAASTVAALCSRQLGHLLPCTHAAVRSGK
jgi:hypothetical protein